MNWPICEKCGYPVPPSEVSMMEMRHGAIWCGACCNEEDTADESATA